MRDVISDLERLRRRGWAMLVSRRLAVIIAATVAVTVTLVLIDFALRLPGPLRLGLLLAGLAGLAVAMWRYVGPAVSFRPSLTQLALRVEDALPGVKGRLASSVEFAGSGIDQSNVLASRTIRETRSRLAGESVRIIARPGPTWRDLAIMLGVLAIVAAAAVAQPEAARIGASRLFMPLSSAQWPARTGVDSMTMGIEHHPRGQPLALRAKATKGEIENMRVNGHYRLTVDGNAGQWRDILLTHQSGGIYERLVETEAQRIEFYFSTDDARTEEQTIELVPPPAVRQATLRATPPSYAAEAIKPTTVDLGPGLDNRSVTETPLLIGSAVRVELELNKAIPVPQAGAKERGQWLKRTFGWAELPLPRLTVDEQSPRYLTLQWQLRKTRELELNLVDEHELSNFDDISYTIEAVEDREPSATIIEPQSDESVLPTAVVDLVAEARDDVAVRGLSLEAKKQPDEQAVGEAAIVWSERAEVGRDVSVQQETQLDLREIEPEVGDVLVVTALARDGYQQDGAMREPSRSAARTLRIIGELDLAQSLRRQLSGVRQNAMRIDAQQGELIDEVIDNSIKPGLDRAQGQVGERLAEQIESLEKIKKRAQRNRLDDQQLENLLQQSSDILEHAGRASNRASEQIDKRLAEEQASQAVEQAGEDDGESKDQQDAGEDGEQGDDQPTAGEEGENEESENDDLRQAEPQDKPAVESQRDVRAELADLIALLDRDEDAWVMTRQIESLLEQMQQLEAETAQLGKSTMGKSRDELEPEQLSELDRIEQRQRELAEQARKLIDDLRKRGEELQDVDPGRAGSMRSAADTAERNELDREMEKAAEQVQQNRMQNARANQQAAQQALDEMLEDIQDSKRAQVEQLQRQVASLIESIKRLITLQEEELIALSRAEKPADYADRARAMIRLNQNTQVTAGDARAAGPRLQNVARLLNRAADAQGAAVTDLRAQPANTADAEAAENRSLEVLNEAKSIAEGLENQVEKEQARQQRAELRQAYAEFLEREAALRGDVAGLREQGEMDRRELVESRRLSTVQDDIRRGLHDLRAETQELMDSRIFTHTHTLIDEKATTVVEALLDGDVSVSTTSRQLVITEFLKQLIAALEEPPQPDDPFAQNQKNQGGQGGQQGRQQQSVIPPIAELKLLRGLQEAIYVQTRNVDTGENNDAGEHRRLLRELGRQQRELLDLGEAMIEALKSGRPPAPAGGDPTEGDTPTPNPEPRPRPVPQRGKS